MKYRKTLRKTFRKNTTWTKNITSEISEKIQGPLLKAKDILARAGIYYPDSSWQAKYDKLYNLLNGLELNPFVIADALKNPWFLSFGVQIASSLVIYIINAYFKGGIEGVRKLSEEKGLYRFQRASKILMKLFVPELEDEMDTDVKKSMMEILVALEKSNLMKMSYVLYKITKKHHSNSPDVTEEDIIRYVEKAGLVIELIYFLYIVNWIVGAPEEIKKRASMIIAMRGGKAGLDEKQLENHVNTAMGKDDLAWINWATYHFLSVFNEEGSSFKDMRKMIMTLFEEFAEEKGTTQEVAASTEEVATLPEVGVDEAAEAKVFAPLQNIIYNSGLSLLLIDAIISRVLLNEGIQYEMGIKGDSVDESIPYIMRKLRTSLYSLDIEKKSMIKDKITKALENPLEFWKQ